MQKKYSPAREVGLLLTCSKAAAIKLRQHAAPWLTDSILVEWEEAARHRMRLVRTDEPHGEVRATQAFLYDPECIPLYPITPDAVGCLKKV